MGTSIEKVIKTLKGKKPPQKIWQEPFDYDSSHYHRLCNLNGSPPSNSDLVNYTLDIKYQKLQPDLLRYLLPICLETWKTELFSQEPSHYGGFIEHFAYALAARPDLEKILGVAGYKVVMEFMRDAILERIEQEVDLHFSGAHASPYQWFNALSSFAVIFPNLETLWSIWWRMDRKGHAIAVLQYVSCLMYEDEENPIFSPWTPDRGGGAPRLWETGTLICDRGWRRENVSFIEQTVTLDYIQSHLDKAAKVLRDDVNSCVPQKMLRDFPVQESLLEARILQLPTLLSLPALAYNNWGV